MWDRLVRGSAVLLAGSVAVFTVAIIIAWIRGLDISCGCFGGTGEINYPVKVAQNVVLIAAGCFFWWKAERQTDAISDMSAKAET